MVQEDQNPAWTLKDPHNQWEWCKRTSMDALQMTPEEVQEQIEYEESVEYQPYADDFGPYEQEEEQENTDYWSTKEQQ